jgi:hypothetical protein
MYARMNPAMSNYTGDDVEYGTKIALNVDVMFETVFEEVCVEHSVGKYGNCSPFEADDLTLEILRPILRLSLKPFA